MPSSTKGALDLRVESSIMSTHCSTKLSTIEVRRWEIDVGLVMCGGEDRGPTGGGGQFQCLQQLL